MVAFKGPNVILGLYKYSYFLTRGKELSAAAGKNKVLGQVKLGGGPGLARRPCVCHLSCK